MDIFLLCWEIFKNTILTEEALMTVLQILWQDLWIHFKNMCFQLPSFVVKHPILDVVGLLNMLEFTPGIYQLVKLMM